jgi:succinate dehydrogenase / fumarate reductase cytochrome b subunit
MSSKQERPLSPHLTIWKWGPHMLVSILHRITGSGLAVVGLAVLTWWLVSLAGGEEAYSKFVGLTGNWIGLTILVGLTWAFWQHLFSGLRHLVLDTGAGYELRINRLWSVMTLAGSLFATGLTWFLLLGVGR